MKTYPKKDIDLPFITTVFVMLLAAMIRLPLLSIPLERDEGGFAYIGRHLFSERLYTDLHDNKLPGLYGLYALFVRLFGYTPEGIHTGLLICNALAIWLMYKLFSNLFNSWTGAISATLFALMSASPNVYGFAAHANQLLIPFALGGLIFVHNGLINNRLQHFGLAGLLLGLAFIIKQQAVLYGVFSGVWMLWNRMQSTPDIRRITYEVAVFSAGAILPFASVCGYFMAVGRFSDLWLWTVELPAQLGNAPNLGDRFSLFCFYFFRVTDHFELLWMVAAIGWGMIPFMKYTREARSFGILFPVFCALSVLIGVAFYPHYFVLCLPAVAMLAAIFIDRMRHIFTGKTGSVLSLAVLLTLVLFPVLCNFGYYFMPDFQQIHQACYGVNRFPEMQEIGKELHEKTLDGDQIAILGSEPEILVVADREAASGHLFMYNLCSEGPKSSMLQQQFLNDLRQSQARFLVRVIADDSWGSNYQNTEFFKNVMAFVDSTYSIEKDLNGIIIYKKKHL